LEVLKGYLTDDEIVDWAKAVIHLTLGFETPGYMDDYDEYMIRFMPTKDDETGAVTIPTEVAEGTSIRMTRRDFEKVSSGIGRLANQIKAQLGENRAKLVLQFDCAGRGKVFLRDQQKIQLLNTLQNQIPDVPWLGFYTLGEIGPVGDVNCFHNYTAVIAAVY
jgi:small ligand-binding sensory domain FIST